MYNLYELTDRPVSNPLTQAEFNYAKQALKIVQEHRLISPSQIRSFYAKLNERRPSESAKAKIQKQRLESKRYRDKLKQVSSRIFVIA